MKAFGVVRFMDDRIFGCREPREDQAFLGGGLAETDTGGRRRTAGIGDPLFFKEGLDLAVFAVFPVQGDEGHVVMGKVCRFEGESSRIEKVDVISGLARGVGDVDSALEADFPTGRELPLRERRSAFGQL